MTRRRSIPETEREAIFERAERCCHWCGQEIDAGREPWDVDHVIALELGGTEDKLDENLQPIHRKGCHAAKTRADVAAIAKSKRMQRRAKGIARTAKNKIPGSRGTGFRVRLTSEGRKVERT